MNTGIFKLILIFSIIILTFQNGNSATNGSDVSIYEEAKSAKQSKMDNNHIADVITISRHTAVTSAVKICEPAIVGINVTEVRQVEYRDPFGDYFDDPFFQQFFGEHGRRRTQQYQVQGLGSGFIISPDGYILTNHHVAGQASKIIVTMTDGSKYNADVVGSDMTSDVALLKIDAKNLAYLKLGDSDDIILGEWVLAFGNPFGLFDLNAKPTITVGVVSNSGINLNEQGRVYKDMIQTDAAISSGNSGGPLVNALGEVIGMNTVIFSTAQSGRGAGSIGIGWAIPVNRIKTVVDLLKKDKKINRNFDVGMEIREIDDEVAHYLQIKKRDGVVVLGVSSKSPAGQAGVEPGDIILEVNGKKILRENDFTFGMADNMVGDKVTFKLLRDDKEMSLSFKLTEKVLQRGRR